MTRPVKKRWLARGTPSVSHNRAGITRIARPEAGPARNMADILDMKGEVAKVIQIKGVKPVLILVEQI
jgi:hypothetical protein